MTDYKYVQIPVCRSCKSPDLEVETYQSPGGQTFYRYDCKRCGKVTRGHAAIRECAAEVNWVSRPMKLGKLKGSER